MKKMLVLCVVLFGWNSQAFAEQGWIKTAKVTKIVVTSAGGINVRITPE